MMSCSQVFVVLFLALVRSSLCFTTPPTHTGRSIHDRTREGLKVSEKSQTEFDKGRRKRKCNPCPEPEDDFDMDRREAAYAMLGSLWAAGALPTMLFPQEAVATYGADANIALPNVVEGISDRVNKQCLVESLGNRECLLYMDPTNKLYQGADNQVLLERLETSSSALATIPELVESKKWSKVIGVLTGPMGTLVTTMDQLSKLSGNTQQAAGLAKQVKTDLYAIAACADRKQVQQALATHKAATDDLVAFVKCL